MAATGTGAPGRLESHSFHFRHRTTFERVLETLDLSPEDVCLVGSVALAAAGIRENRDVDFVVRPENREHVYRIARDHESYEIKPHGGIQLGESVEIPMADKTRPIGVTDRDLVTDDRYHHTIDGLKVIRLEVEAAFKAVYARRKERRDLERIREASALELDPNDELACPAPWPRDRAPYLARLHLRALTVRNRLIHDGMLPTIRWVPKRAFCLCTRQ